MHRPVLLALAIAVLSLTTSCATIFNGSSQEVTFTSSDPDTEVIAGDQRGQTPCTLEIPRALDAVTFKSRVRGEREVVLDSSFQVGWMLMDILFTPGFGSSGLLVDLASQSWWNHPAIVHCDFDAAPDRAVARAVERP